MDAEFLPNIFGSVVNLVALCIFVAGVMKVFQVANTLNEIRDTVKDIRRYQDTTAPLGLPLTAETGQSGDEMLKSLDAQLNLHPSVEVEPVKPEIIQPR